MTNLTDLLIGDRIVPSPLAADATELHFDDPSLRLHQGTPWLNAWLKTRHDIDAREIGALPGGDFSIEQWLLGYHAVVFGASGSGKTRLALYLLRAQLMAGCSAVVLDYKEDTPREAAKIGRQCGLDDEDITVLWPSDPDAPVPGWNPFAVPLDDVDTAVDRFVSAVRADAGSWGDRLDAVLRNAATVIAAQGLSALELKRFIQRDDYREGLLRQAWGTPAWAEYPERGKADPLLHPFPSQ